jgi:hypothetical protein
MAQAGCFYIFNMLTLYPFLSEREYIILNLTPCILWISITINYKSVYSQVMVYVREG